MFMKQGKHFKSSANDHDRSEHGIYKIFFIIIDLFMAMSFSSYASAGSLDQSSMSYHETTDSFENPERGFYTPVFLKLESSGTVIPESELGQNLIHLRVDISAFGGAGKNISSSALEALGKTLQMIRQNGGTAIIRFAYDVDFSGGKVLEPGLDRMKKHIGQLSTVLNEQEPVIVCVETGMLGVYGEYHGTGKCTLKNRKGILQAWLENLSAKFKVSVRTPCHIAEWAGISLEELCRKGTSKKGIGRIGIYNDGYLGSNSDLGTYENREDELDWLDEQTDTTFFGGEMAAYYDEDTPKNTAKYMEGEGFITHTSYLNVQWNDTVIAALKKEKFNGKDSLYKDLSGYTYVDNHLGYRFVLKDSRVSAVGHYLNVFMQINNVGFGSMVNDKTATILLESENKVYELPLADFDIRDCKSQYKIGYKNCMDISEVESGDYKVYLRISEDGDHTSDNNYNCVRFANDSSQWNELFGANLIGRVQIAESEEVLDVLDDVYTRTLEISDLNQRFESVGGIRYKLDKSKAVMKRVDNKKSITIPNKIVVNKKTYTVTGLNSRLFLDCSKATNIKILNDTKTIPKGTFSNCKKLKSITLNKSIKKIAKGSICNRSLKKIIYLGKKAQFKKLKLDWLHHVKVYASNGTIRLK